jgi:hypothetical protein
MSESKNKKQAPAARPADGPETTPGQSSHAAAALLPSSSGTQPLPERPPKKTPMWQAKQALRYQRQAIIKEITRLREAEVICYVGGNQTEITRDDVVFFGDLLYNVPRGANVDFLLHTKGGDMDAAEKLCAMVREVVGTKTLTVVVPDYAKSSGTLIALGADEIMMSDSSELGPIDPQIVIDDGDGKRMSASLHSYLKAYDEHANALRADPSNPVARMMLDKFEPAKVHQFRLTKERVRQLAEKQLRAGMFKPPRHGNTTGIPLKLMDVEQYSSHAQMIGYSECKGMGLKVDYRAPGDEIWDMYWQLYCFQRLEIGDSARKKLFESSFSCLASE